MYSTLFIQIVNNTNFYRKGNIQSKISLDEEMINTKV